MEEGKTSSVDVGGFRKDWASEDWTRAVIRAMLSESQCRRGGNRREGIPHAIEPETRSHNQSETQAQLGWQAASIIGFEGSWRCYDGFKHL